MKATTLLGVAGLISLLLLQSCGVSDKASLTPLRVDSAGVTIVVNRALPTGPPWRLGQPMVTLGSPSASGDILGLYRVSDVLLLPEVDRAILTDRGLREVRFYELSTGELVSRFGSRGDGPTEFRGLSSLAVLSQDSILAVDPMRARIVILDADGRMQAAVALPALPGLPPPKLVGVSDGKMMITAQEGGPSLSKEGIHRGRVAIAATPYDGSAQAVQLLDVPGPERLVIREGSGASANLFPWAKGPLFSVSDSTLYTSDSSEPVIHGVSVEGRLRTITRWPSADTNRPTRTALVDDWVSRIASERTQTRLRRVLLQHLDDTTLHRPTQGAWIVTEQGIEIYSDRGELLAAFATPSPSVAWVRRDGHGRIFVSDGAGSVFVGDDPTSPAAVRCPRLPERIAIPIADRWEPAGVTGGTDSEGFP